MEKSYTKNCPSCNKQMVYASKYNLTQSIKNNKSCGSCSAIIRNKKYGSGFIKLNNEVKLGIRENGFKGKKHREDTKSKLRGVDRSYTKTDEFRNKLSSVTKGENNPMYNKSFYDIWIKKYGKEIADQKLIDFKQKISNSTSGKNNPMFGKPSPAGSGNGWKGWYNGVFFRSLLELSFLVNYVDRFNMKFESGEKAKWAIEYVTPMGKMGTYFPDYIINDKYMVEIKPKSLVNTPLVKAKTLAAVAYCDTHCLKYKIITPQKLSEDFITKMIEDCIIILTDTYKTKFYDRKNKQEPS
jgi:hypothetical protein